MTLAKALQAAAGNAGSAEFLYLDNFEQFLIGEVTVDVDTVFTSPTDTDQDPIVVAPQSNLTNPTTGYVKQKSPSGTYVFLNSNRAFVSFEDEIANTDVSAVIDVDFDAQSFSTCINNASWANTNPSNLRYVEGATYFYISNGAGNAPIGYNLTTNATFSWTPPTTASNANDSRFQDPTLNSLHEGCYTTNSTTYDLWTFQGSSTTVLTENVSDYFNSAVGVNFRHWSPVHFDDSFVFWVDNERIGYSAKGVSNSTPVSGYNILANSTGVSPNPDNGDTWAFGYTNAYSDIWGNTYLYNTNSSDPNFRRYRRLYNNSGTATFTSWEDPLASLRPATSGSYAVFSDIYSAGTPDYQVASITIYDAATATSTTSLYKMTGTTTFDGPYTAATLAGWSLRYVNAKTIFAHQVVDNKTFKVRLYRAS